MNRVPERATVVAKVRKPFVFELDPRRVTVRPRQEEAWRERLADFNEHMNTDELCHPYCARGSKINCKDLSHSVGHLYSKGLDCVAKGKAVDLEPKRRSMKVDLLGSEVPRPGFENQHMPFDAPRGLT